MISSVSGLDTYLKENLKLKRHQWDKIQSLCRLKTIQIQRGGGAGADWLYNNQGKINTKQNKTKKVNEQKWTSYLNVCFLKNYN